MVSFIGNMLNIKPICTIENIKNKIVSKVKGNKEIASKLADMILDANNNDLESKTLTIRYDSNEEDFEKLKEEVTKGIKAKRVYITRGVCYICSYTGPKILAVSSSK